MSQSIDRHACTAATTTIQPTMTEHRFLEQQTAPILVAAKVFRMSAAIARSPVKLVVASTDQRLCVTVAVWVDKGATNQLAYMEEQ